MKYKVFLGSFDPKFKDDSQQRMNEVINDFIDGKNVINIDTNLSPASNHPDNRLIAIVTTILYEE